MAAVTSTDVGRHVWGDCVVRFFTASGATGSTLDTALAGVYFVGVQPGSLITGFTQVQSAAGTTVLTLSSSGPMVNEVIMVVARKG